MKSHKYIISILTLIGIQSLARIPTLCERDNPCVDEAECKIDPKAPIIGKPFCVCPKGMLTYN